MSHALGMAACLLTYGMFASLPVAAATINSAMPENVIGAEMCRVAMHAHDFQPDHETAIQGAS